MNAKEAATAKQEADATAAGLAQMTAKSGALQEQRTYTSAMTELVKDDKAALTKFPEVKNAIANAFAGKDSKAVEKAMELGELLDRMRQKQQQVTDIDMKVL